MKTMKRRNFLKAFLATPVASILMFRKKHEVYGADLGHLEGEEVQIYGECPPLTKIKEFVNDYKNDGYIVEEILASNDIYDHMTKTNIDGIPFVRSLTGYENKISLIIMRTERVCGNIIPLRYIVMIDMDIK